MLLILTLGGCYYDVEELLYPEVECSVEQMSFSEDITPILSDNCYSCHASEIRLGNVALDVHNEVIKYTDDNTLLGVIKHLPGYSPMPQNGAQLLECEIEKIEGWIEQGALNN